MNRDVIQHRGELCGNCTGYAATKILTREQCPGQWFVDSIEGERAICGLVAGVLTVVAHEGNSSEKGTVFQIQEIQNPLNY